MNGSCERRNGHDDKPLGRAPIPLFRKSESERLRRRLEEVAEREPDPALPSPPAARPSPYHAMCRLHPAPWPQPPSVLRAGLSVPLLSQVGPDLFANRIE